MATRPVLVLEGAGDKEAVPFLIRELSSSRIFPAPNPILKQSVGRLSSQGELERFVNYALIRDEGDSVLFLLDTDEKCAKTVIENWVPRLRVLSPGKKVGVGLFVREFEAFFLACLDGIAEQYPTYGWSLNSWQADDDHEAPRGAKERLASYMKKGKSYKETSDQAKFVSALDHRRLRDRCRSFQHLESLLSWLLEDNGETVYPFVVV